MPHKAKGEEFRDIVLSVTLFVKTFSLFHDFNFSVKEARLKEIKSEILNSEKLKVSD